MRDPGPGVSRVLTFQRRYGAGAGLTALGDVNGDRHADFLESTEWYTDRRAGDSLIVYGGNRSSFTATVEIEDLPQTRFVWNGDTRFIAWGDGTFRALGDVDMDGYDDFLMGSRFSWEGEAEFAGAAFLVFGAPSYPTEIKTTTPDELESTLRSLRFISRDPDRHAGSALGSAGDLNADGLLDYAIGAAAPGSEDGVPFAGRIYLIYGGLERESNLELSEVGASVPGAVLHGAFGKGAFDNLGGDSGAMAAVGDMDGDGFADFAAGIIGTRLTVGGGAVYIVRGGPGLPRDLYLARPNDRLLEIQGTGQLGASVAAAGDVDQDGHSDLLVNAAQAGIGYVIYGSAQWPASQRHDSPMLRQLQLRGTSQGPLIPFQYEGIGGAAGAGDWDADGVLDLLFTAAGHTVRFGSLTGECYLVFGKPGLEGSFRDIDVGTSTLPGIRMTGHDSLVQLGSPAGPGGDLDGDGRQELLISASTRLGPDASPERSSIFILFGDADLGRTLALTAVEPADGPIAGGTLLTLRGRGFRGGETVTVGGQAAVDVQVVSSAEIKARSPAGLEAGPVKVEVSQAGASVQLESGFTYTREGYPDLFLDPKQLRAQGYRVLSFRDTVQPAPSPGLQFVNLFRGDANGDGIDDLAIGTPIGTADGSYGRVVLLFGRRGGFPETVGPGELGDLGTAIEGSADAPRSFTAWIAFPGDLNGDGLPEVALGQYVLFGRATWPRQMLLAEELAAGRALDLHDGVCGDHFNSAPGDLDADGTGDLVLSFDVCNPGTGKVSIHTSGLLPGNANPDPSIEITADPSVILEPPGILTLEARRFGWLTGGRGDWNGDGRPDLIVGADHAVGVCFGVLGPYADFRSASITEIVEAGRAVTVRSSLVSSRLGRDTWLVGDVNGDGIDDALFGVSGGGRDFHGASYLVYGSTSIGASRTTIDLQALGDKDGVEILGEASYDWSGHVSGIGDWNRDGFADLAIIGEYHRDVRPRAYVVLGGPDLPRRIKLPYLGRHGFTITGRAGNNFSAGHSTLASGDFDGDGLQDLAVGEGDGVTEPAFRRRHVVVIFGKPQGEATFVRGEANGDGKLDLADAVSILGYLFLGAGTPPCLDALDADDDGSISLTDAVYVLQHLFLGGAQPPAPYPDPGADPTADALGCLGAK